MRASHLMRSRVATAALLGATLTISPVTEAATKNYDLGDRIAAYELTATTGETRILTLESPSIVVLWATWSPRSLTALTEILRAAPQGGIRWQIVPINVDAAALAAADTARVHAAGREAGWNGPVWHDRGLRIFHEWGTIALPTVVITALGGNVDEIEHDWTGSVRDRLFGLYFGAYTDSFPGMSLPPSTESCRSATHDARRLWRMSKLQSAIDAMQSACSVCPDLPDDAGRLAAWIWKTGDTMRVEARINEVLSKSEPGAWPLLVQSTLAQRRGQCDSAADFARQSLRYDSAFAPAWVQLAESALLCGETDEAARAYERARHLNMLDPRVHAIGGRIAAKRGDHKSSTLLMRWAVEERLRLAKR